MVAIPYSRTLVGGLPWYSVLIVTGIVLALWLTDQEAKRRRLPKDTAVDLALVVVPCGIVGARLYYVVMSWEAFAADPISTLYIWNGGIAIYGGVIGGALGALAYAKKKHLSFAVLLDCIAPGLLLAQAIGRWGNYFNMEAYGPVIANPRLQFFPMAVLIPNGQGMVWHAATFFYESAWNLMGFFVLWLLRRRQNGEGRVFAWYLVVYGSGRFCIEQLRQDSLYMGGIRASQYLSVVLCVAAVAFLLWQKRSMLWRMACALLWTARWFCMQSPAVYALCMLLAYVLTGLLIRRQRRAHVLMLTALCLDGIGLAMALAEWPVSPAFSAQFHLLLCSATLLMGIGALTHEG